MLFQRQVEMSYWCGISSGCCQPFRGTVLSEQHGEHWWRWGCVSVSLVAATPLGGHGGGRQHNGHGDWLNRCKKELGRLGEHSWRTCFKSWALRGKANKKSERCAVCWEEGRQKLTLKVRQQCGPAVGQEESFSAHRGCRVDYVGPRAWSVFVAV